MINRTAKRLEDPMLSNRAFAIFFILTILIAIGLLLAPKAGAQTTYTYSTSTSSPTWTTVTNWTVGGNPSTKFPGDGVGTVTNEGTATDIAAFGIVTAAANGVAINFNNLNGGLTLGAIDFLSSSSRVVTIGNSSTAGGQTSALLTLTGQTLNTISNTILSNEGTKDLTLQPLQGGTFDMSVGLGNATNNIIQINGTGGITISTVIQNGAGSNLTLTGNGSGILTFSGATANTYNGTTTINSGQLDLSKSAGVDAIAGNLTIGDGVGLVNTAKVRLTANDQIKNTSDVTINSDGQLDLNGKSETIDGLNSSSSTASVSLGSGGALTVGANNEASASFAGVISGGNNNGNLVKSGSGTQILTGNNTYGGTTTINASGGTLEIANSGSTSSGRISGTSSVTVNSGGTLLLSGSSSFTDRIKDTATMTLSGGTFNTGGLSEINGAPSATAFGIGALTLTATSTINFGSGNTSIIEFSGLGTHTVSTILQITNWDGIAVTGGGTERLLFAGTATSFTSLYNQSDVSFNGVTGYVTDQFTGFYEVTAVIPEPSTWISGALAVGILGWSQRRRFARMFRRAA